jgi:hypothetical protein
MSLTADDARGSLRTLQVLSIPRNRRSAPHQRGGVLPPIGQRHAQQPLVHVLGWTVSRPMGAVNLAASGNGYEGGTCAGTHPDSVGT